MLQQYQRQTEIKALDAGQTEGRPNKETTTKDVRNLERTNETKTADYQQLRDGYARIRGSRFSEYHR